MSMEVGQDASLRKARLVDAVEDVEPVRGGDGALGGSPTGTSTIGSAQLGFLCGNVSYFSKSPEIS